MHPNKLTPALALVAAAIFTWVAVHEFSYAGSHPYASSLAEVLAWGGVAGALLAAAVALHWWDIDDRLARHENARENDEERPLAGAKRALLDDIEQTARDEV